MKKKILILQFTICPLLHALGLLSALLYAFCLPADAQ